MNIKPTDAKQVGDGDTILLMVGDYDPPTMSYFRTIESALSRPDVSEIWLAPTAEGGEHSSAMAMVLASFASQSLRKMVGTCTAGLDKGLDALGIKSWCESSYPTLRFKTLGFSGCEDVFVAFKGDITEGRNEVLLLNRFLRIDREGIIDKIRSGRDASRDFPSPVWEYIKRNRLYR